jgi:hypothetical protein
MVGQLIGVSDNASPLRRTLTRTTNRIIPCERWSEETDMDQNRRVGISVVSYIRNAALRLCLAPDDLIEHTKSTRCTQN